MKRGVFSVIKIALMRNYCSFLGFEENVKMLLCLFEKELDGFKSFFHNNYLKKQGREQQWGPTKSRLWPLDYIYLEDWA